MLARAHGPQTRAKAKVGARLPRPEVKVDGRLASAAGDLKKGVDSDGGACILLNVTDLGSKELGFTIQVASIKAQGIGKDDNKTKKDLLPTTTTTPQTSLKLVFVVDVSGSMGDYSQLIVQRVLPAIRTLSGIDDKTLTPLVLFSTTTRTYNCSQASLRTFSTFEKSTTRIAPAMERVGEYLTQSCTNGDDVRLLVVSDGEVEDKPNLTLATLSVTAQLGKGGVSVRSALVRLITSPSNPPDTQALACFGLLDTTAASSAITIADVKTTECAFIADLPDVQRVFASAGSNGLQPLVLLQAVDKSVRFFSRPGGPPMTECLVRPGDAMTLLATGHLDKGLVCHKSLPSSPLSAAGVGERKLDVIARRPELRSKTTIEPLYSEEQVTGLLEYIHKHLALSKVAGLQPMHVLDALAWFDKLVTRLEKLKMLSASAASRSGGDGILFMIPGGPGGDKQDSDGDSKAASKGMIPGGLQPDRDVDVDEGKGDYKASIGSVGFQSPQAGRQLLAERRRMLVKQIAKHKASTLLAISTLRGESSVASMNAERKADFLRNVSAADKSGRALARRVATHDAEDPSVVARQTLTQVLTKVPPLVAQDQQNARNARGAEAAPLSFFGQVSTLDALADAMELAPETIATMEFADVLSLVGMTGLAYHGHVGNFPDPWSYVTAVKRVFPETYLQQTDHVLVATNHRRVTAPGFGQDQDSVITGVMPLVRCAADRLMFDSARPIVEMHVAHSMRKAMARMPGDVAAQAVGVALAAARSMSVPTMRVTSALIGVIQDVVHTLTTVRGLVGQYDGADFQDSKTNDIRVWLSGDVNVTSCGKPLAKLLAGHVKSSDALVRAILGYELYHAASRYHDPTAAVDVKGGDKEPRPSRAFLSRTAFVSEACEKRLLERVNMTPLSTDDAVANFAQDKDFVVSVGELTFTHEPYSERVLGSFHAILMLVATATCVVGFDKHSDEARKDSRLLHKSIEAEYERMMKQYFEVDQDKQRRDSKPTWQALVLQANQASELSMRISVTAAVGEQKGGAGQPAQAQTRRFLLPDVGTEDAALAYIASVRFLELDRLQDELLRKKRASEEPLVQKQYLTALCRCPRREFIALLKNGMWTGSGGSKGGAKTESKGDSKSCLPTAAERGKFAKQLALPTTTADPILLNELVQELLDTADGDSVERKKTVSLVQGDIVDRVHKLRILLTGTDDGVQWNNGNPWRKTFFQEQALDVIRRTDTKTGGKVATMILETMHTALLHKYRESDKPNHSGHCNSVPSWFALGYDSYAQYAEQDPDRYADYVKARFSGGGFRRPGWLREAHTALSVEQDQ
jgi:hypothetical protein